MKTIIAATDFTAASLNACNYAALLAQTLKCKLTLFNLLDAPMLHVNAGLYGITQPSPTHTSYNRTVKLAKGLQARFPELKIESFVTLGNFKEELGKFIATHRVAAAVMGLEAKKRISRYIYGSHGIDVAGKLDCPVIIVPSGYKRHQLKKILLTVDNKEKLHQASLKPLDWIVKQSASQLSVLHVRTEDELLAPAMKDLKLGDKKIPVSVRKARQFQDGLKTYCHDGRFDLVAIISKKHSAFYDFFQESHTKKVAIATRVPVVAFHL